MRRLALLVALLASVPAIAGAAQPRIQSGTLFVTERALGSVAAIDAATGEKLWVTKVGASPIGVMQPQGTDKVYSSDEGSNRMSVLDRRTGELLRTIPMGPGPHHQLASKDGGRIYVGEFFHNEVGVVDTKTDTRVAGWVANPLPEARTHAVWITKDEQDLYATNTRADRSQQGDVAHLDAQTGERLCNTTVGADPSEILVTNDGKTGYVSVRRENKIKELDTSGICPVLTGREAVIGTMPDTLRLTNDGKTLVVTLRGIPAQISLLDTETWVVRTVTIPGHLTTGHHWLSANGKTTYVAVESPGGVAVVDNETGTVLDDYPYPGPPGGIRPHGVFYVPEVLR
jgi:DNA-binding beta-propeller fold protein YncE